MNRCRFNKKKNINNEFTCAAQLHHKCDGTMNIRRIKIVRVGLGKVDHVRKDYALSNQFCTEKARPVDSKSI